MLRTGLDRTVAETCRSFLAVRKLVQWWNKHSRDQFNKPTLSHSRCCRTTMHVKFFLETKPDLNHNHESTCGCVWLCECLSHAYEAISAFSIGVLGDLFTLDKPGSNYQGVCARPHSKIDCVLRCSSENSVFLVQFSSCRSVLWQQMLSLCVRVTGLVNNRGRDASL